MSFFVWEESLDLGIDVIDQQHRQIADYINNLNDAIETGDTDLVGEIIERLKDYTEDHFAFEEQLLKRAGYILFEPHVKVHRRFIERLTEFEYHFRSGKDPMVIARKIRNTLMIWLTQHIKTEDANYAPVVKKIIRRETGWIGGALKRIFSRETA